MIANAFNAGFHLIAHRALPFPIGSSARAARQRRLSAACSVGKCPRAGTAAGSGRSRTGSRSSNRSPGRSRCRSRRTGRSPKHFVQGGTPIRPGVLPQSGTRRVAAAALAGELDEQFLGRRFRRSGVDGPQIPAHLVPIRPRSGPECVAYQMNNARLHHRERADGVDRIRETLKSVTDDDAHLGNARFVMSVSTESQNFALSPPSSAHTPRMSRSPLTVTPTATYTGRVVTCPSRTLRLRPAEWCTNRPG